MVLTTVGSKMDAEIIARTLVTEQLAACVQRLPVQSCYRWNEEVIEEPEQLLLIKTTSDRYLDVQARIRELHKYEIPEIIQVPVVRGFDQYLAWVNENVR